MTPDNRQTPIEKVCGILGSTAPNVDPANGIHYGCISQHSVNQESLSDIFDNGRNLSYESAQADFKANLRATLKDYFSDYKFMKETSTLDDCVEACYDAVEQEWNDGYEDSGESVYLYEQDGYKLSTSPSLVAVFVEKSPYYTFARGCSPCAPNAGDLDNATAEDNGNLKTYCLGPDWFGDESPIPYACYDVVTDKVIESAIESVPEYTDVIRIEISNDPVICLDCRHGNHDVQVPVVASYVAGCGCPCHGGTTK